VAQEDVAALPGVGQPVFAQHRRAPVGQAEGHRPDGVAGQAAVDGGGAVVVHVVGRQEAQRAAWVPPVGHGCRGVAQAGLVVAGAFERGCHPPAPPGDRLGALASSGRIGLTARRIGLGLVDELPDEVTGAQGRAPARQRSVVGLHLPQPVLGHVPVGLEHRLAVLALHVLLPQGVLARGEGEGPVEGRGVVGRVQHVVGIQPPHGVGAVIGQDLRREHHLEVVSPRGVPTEQPQQGQIAVVGVHRRMRARPVVLLEEHADVAPVGRVEIHAGEPLGAARPQGKARWAYRGGPGARAEVRLEGQEARQVGVEGWAGVLELGQGHVAPGAQLRGPPGELQIGRLAGSGRAGALLGEHLRPGIALEDPQPAAHVRRLALGHDPDDHAHVLPRVVQRLDGPHVGDGRAGRLQEQPRKGGQRGRSVGPGRRVERMALAAEADGQEAGPGEASQHGAEAHRAAEHPPVPGDAGHEGAKGAQVQAVTREEQGAGAPGERPVGRQARVGPVDRHSAGGLLEGRDLREEAEARVDGVGGAAPAGLVVAQVVDAAVLGSRQEVGEGDAGHGQHSPSRGQEALQIVQGVQREGLAAGQDQQSRLRLQPGAGGKLVRVHHARLQAQALAQGIHEEARGHVGHGGPRAGGVPEHDGLAPGARRPGLGVRDVGGPQVLDGRQWQAAFAQHGGEPWAHDLGRRDE